MTQPADAHHLEARAAGGTMPSQPIRILPETKAVMRWADKGHNRASLETVLFEPDGRQVATNGHGLAMLTTSPCSHEYPPVNGLEPMTESPGRTLIRASDLEEVLKALPKPGRVRRFPWLRQAVQLASGTGTLTFGTTDGEQSCLFCLVPSEGQFPTYARVIPQGLPRLRMGFDLAYLKRLVESFETLQARTVQLQFYGPEHPLYATGTDPEGRSQLAIVLMPVRLDPPTTRGIPELDEETASMLLRCALEACP